MSVFKNFFPKLAYFTIFSFCIYILTGLVVNNDIIIVIFCSIPLFFIMIESLFHFIKLFDKNLFLSLTKVSIPIGKQFFSKLFLLFASIYFYDFSILCGFIIYVFVNQFIKIYDEKTNI